MKYLLIILALIGAIIMLSCEKQEGEVYISTSILEEPTSIKISAHSYSGINIIEYTIYDKKDSVLLYKEFVYTDIYQTNSFVRITIPQWRGSSVYYNKIDYTIRDFDKHVVTKTWEDLQTL